MQYNQNDGTWTQPPSPKSNSVPWWGWLLIAIGGLGLLGCCTCTGLLMWLGSITPDTAVYAGHAIPSDYHQTMVDVGAIDANEQVVYLYSDAMTDIRDGFYFVSDQKVGVYNQNTMPPHGTYVPFGDIAKADLYRDTSFLIDSTITLELKDGTFVSLPVSSEQDGDVRFHEAIQKNISP